MLPNTHPVTPAELADLSKMMVRSNDASHRKTTTITTLLSVQTAPQIKVIVVERKLAPSFPVGIGHCERAAADLIDDV